MRRKRRNRIVVLSLLLVTAVVGLLLGRNKAMHSAAGESQDESQPSVIAATIVDENTKMPAAYQRIVEGIEVVQSANGEYHPIGSEFEQVLVGQRTAKRKAVSSFEGGEMIVSSVAYMEDQSDTLSQKTKISDSEYETLLSIVEAEAGGEDAKGRILVANVIFNRVESDQFPDNVVDVVWQESGGSAQFSPTADGRINTVEITDTTREAVNRAIDGEDYSEGALFFIEIATADKKNVDWFNENLKKLFTYGCHTFYDYY